MSDIIFKTDEYVFSYRVAGILVHNEMVLLQRPVGESGFAAPGGHVAFGETTRETLIREFREETGAVISVGDLVAVGELFFPWFKGGKTCHQICLYYHVSLDDSLRIPLEGVFGSEDSLNDETLAVEFCWIPIASLDGLKLYPDRLKEVTGREESAVLHFVYHE